MGDDELAVPARRPCLPLDRHLLSLSSSLLIFVRIVRFFRRLVHNCG